MHIRLTGRFYALTAAVVLLTIVVLFGPVSVLRRDSQINEFEYLISLQRQDGAICQTPQQDKIVPYFANLTAWAMLDHPGGENRVKAYLQWYLHHLNRPDRWGLTGTIYDYRFDQSSEQPTLDYDSADSYAATFLSLMNQYVKDSGDSQFAREHSDDLELIAGVLVTMQDADGLLWAKPQYPLKFLMDNCENYRGLIDYAELLRTIGEKEKSQSYARLGVKVRQGILCYLWDQKNQRYHWAVDKKGNPQPFREQRWYPDMVAQIYPILNGIDWPGSDRAIKLYAELNQQFPNWPQMEKGDPYPWALVTYVAALMGDTQRAKQALATMEQQHVLAVGQPYWYSLEHAFYMRAKQELMMR